MRARRAAKLRGRHMRDQGRYRPEGGRQAAPVPRGCGAAPAMPQRGRALSADAGLPGGRGTSWTWCTFCIDTQEGLLLGVKIQ